MSLSQRATYKLQQKMDRISTEEYAELRRIDAGHFNNENGMVSANYRKAEIREKFNRRRNRAIWWYQHQFDVVAVVVILVVVIAAFVYFVR